MRRADRWAQMNHDSSTTPLEQVDRDLTVSVNGKRDSWPVRTIGAISDVADQPQMRLLCVATAGLGLLHGDGKLMRAGVRMLAAHTVATWAKSGIKAVVDRTRPESGDEPEVRRGSSDAHERNSFPSGHSTGAIAVAQAFVREYPEHGPAARAAALAVSAIQIPRGAHYLGDVLAGAAIGWVSEWLAHEVAPATKPRLQRTLMPFLDGRSPGSKSDGGEEQNGGLGREAK